MLFSSKDEIQYLFVAKIQIKTPKKTEDAEYQNINKNLASSKVSYFHNEVLFRQLKTLLINESEKMEKRETPYGRSNMKEIENVIHLIKNNIDCTKDLITQIDVFLEAKQLPQSLLDELVSQRNACAVNVMNFTRVLHLI